MLFLQVFFEIKQLFLTQILNQLFTLGQLKFENLFLITQ